MKKQLIHKEYVIDREILYRNRVMFIDEGIKRGYSIKKIHPHKLVFFVEKKGKGFIYDTLPGALTIRTRFPSIANKFYQKKMMSSVGIGVAQNFSIIKSIEKLDKSLVQFPCVVKPAIGSRSKNVTVNINTDSELLIAVQNIINTKTVAIVEEMHVGKEYRILVINGIFVSCVQRRPASVVGDGVHTLQELIDIKNNDNQRGLRNSVNHTLHKIIIDDAVNKKLKKDKITLESIIEEGVIITITTKINTSVGADLVDCTQTIHNDFIKLAEDFAQKYKLFIVGFDVIANDIKSKSEEQKYIFNELNEQPFFDISEKCNIGEGVPVASIIWDEIEKNKIVTENFSFF